MTNGMTYSELARQVLDRQTRSEKWQAQIADRLARSEEQGNARGRDISEIKKTLKEVNEHFQGFRDLEIEVAKNKQGVTNNRWWIRAGLPAVLALAGILGTALSQLL